MDVDIILFWLALFSAVMFLASRRGPLWTGKALALILGSGLCVLVRPDLAGWAAGGGWAVLLAIPSFLADLSSRFVFAQDFRSAARISILGTVLQPDRRFRAQTGLVRAMADAQRGEFDSAIARLDVLRADRGTPPDLALTAHMHLRRLQDRWDDFLREACWSGCDPELATMTRMRALAALGWVEELIALERSADAPRLGAGSGAGSALALMYFLTGCGRIDALAMLLRGPLRRLAPQTRALQLALATLAGGGDEDRARDILARLRDGTDRDVARAAAHALLRPPQRVTLDEEQRQVTLAVEREIAAVVRARGRRRPPPARVTVTLIALNCAAFGLEVALGGSEDMHALRLLGALSPAAVIRSGEWWRVVTALFLHYGWVHIGVNMLSLAVIGTATERSFGAWRTLAIYMVAGVGSMATVVGLTAAHVLPSEFVVGASGAIMGLIGALLAVAIRTWQQSRTRAALGRVLWVAGAIALQSALDLATPQISFTGHLSGVIAGLLIGTCLLPRTVRMGARTQLDGAGAPAPRMTLDRRTLVLTCFGAVVALVASLALPERRDSGGDADSSGDLTSPDADGR